MRSTLLSGFVIGSLLVGGTAALAEGNAALGKSATTPPECARFNPEGGAVPAQGVKASEFSQCMNDVKQKHDKNGAAGSSTSPSDAAHRPDAPPSRSPTGTGAK